MQDEKTVTMSMAEYDRLIGIEKNQDKIKIIKKYYGNYEPIVEIAYVGENEAIKQLLSEHENTIAELTNTYKILLHDEKLKVSALELELSELKKKKRFFWE